MTSDTLVTVAKERSPEFRSNKMATYFCDGMKRTFGGIRCADRISIEVTV